MKKTIRQRRQEQTKLALLQKGEQEVRRVGIGNISVRYICESSGYTLGAFYSNFKNKDEFLILILEMLVNKLFCSLDLVIKKTITSGLTTSKKALISWVEEMKKDELMSDLLLEFTFYAKHDDKFRKLFTPYMDMWREQIATALEQLFSGLKLIPKISYKNMAISFSALWQGLTLEAPLYEMESTDSVSSILTENILRVIDTAEPQE